MGFKEMFNSCPFIEEAAPLLAHVKEHNRRILKERGSIDAAKGLLDLFTERYLQTYSEVKLSCLVLLLHSIDCTIVTWN